VKGLGATNLAESPSSSFYRPNVEERLGTVLVWPVQSDRASFLLAPRPLSQDDLSTPRTTSRIETKRTKAKVTQVSEVQRWRRGLALQLAEIIRLAGGQHGFYIWTAPCSPRTKRKEDCDGEVFSLHAPGTPSTTLEPNAIGSSNQLSKGAAGNSNVSLVRVRF
jgi:hypothetical protein